MIFVDTFPFCIDNRITIGKISSNHIQDNNSKLKIQRPIRKIIFGSPGTGKIHKIEHEIIPSLGIEGLENVVGTVFHPEYTYGDFMGKLVPITKGKDFRYKFCEGHFLIAPTKSYQKRIEKYQDIIKNIDFKELEEGQKKERIKQAHKDACNEDHKVILVIYEINRGNSSAIFGTIFQLLDRQDNEWSSYFINITEIELLSILKLLGVKEIELAGNSFEYKFPGESERKNLSTLKSGVDCLNMNIEYRSIKIPPNLSIVGTINTSDNSIYFMDSAFKRRWEWEFVDWDESKPETTNYSEFDVDNWHKLVKQINILIKDHYDSVRGVEDDQIGYYFIKVPVTSIDI